MRNTTYRAFPEKLGTKEPTKFVGDKGVFYCDVTLLSLAHAA